MFLKKSAQHLGQKGEMWASDHLSRLGFKILESNWRVREGEIDLIVQKKKVLVFVEVKYRRNRQFGSGAEAIHPMKQKKMVRAILRYLQSKKFMDQEIRLGALIIEGENPPSFEFFEFPLDLPNLYYY